jgi:cytochrome c2
MKNLAMTVLLVLFCMAIAFALDAAVENGKEVYSQQKCSMCHSIAGVGGKLASLDHVGTKLNADQIKEWIRTPKNMKPDVLMKPYADLPEKDLDDLTAYLLTLK